MKEEIKAIIDTNVFINLLIAKGMISSSLYAAFVRTEFTPVLSLEMEAELLEVIHRPKFNKYFTKNDTERFEELIKTDAIFVFSTPRIALCRDEKDNMILACASSSEVKVDFIVTGDEDLLILKSFRGIPIVTPQEFLKILRK